MLVNPASHHARPLIEWVFTNFNGQKAFVHHTRFTRSQRLPVRCGTIAPFKTTIDD